MNVFYGLENLPEFKNAVVTIGTFDGVHTGHQVILNRLRQKALEIEGESVIITFEPHPRFVISSHSPAIELLNTVDEKIDNLRAERIHNLVIVEFTPQFAAMDAADYVQKFLYEKFHPHTIIIGYDHLFGRARKGNFQLLEDLKSEFHFELEEIPMQVIEHNKISSTQIRQALQRGDVAKAALYLGRAYVVEGIVTEGRKKGRELGFPTANINIAEEHKLVPASGVYAVKVKLHEKQYGGMLNIGTKPTFADAQGSTIEVNIFDFDGNIYGEKLKILFVARLRDEIKFDRVNELIKAIENDKVCALQVLAGGRFF